MYLRSSLRLAPHPSDVLGKVKHSLGARNRRGAALSLYASVLSTFNGRLKAYTILGKCRKKMYRNIYIFGIFKINYTFPLTSPCSWNIRRNRITRVVNMSWNVLYADAIMEHIWKCTNVCTQRVATCFILPAHGMVLTHIDWLQYIGSVNWIVIVVVVRSASTFTK